MKKLFVGLCLVLFCQTTAVAFAAELECPASSASIDEAVIQARHYLGMELAADISALAAEKQIDNIKAENENDPSNEAVRRLLEKAKQDKELYEILSKSMGDLYKCSMKQIAGK